MPRLLRIARRYWIVTLTIAIGLLGIVLAAVGRGRGRAVDLQRVRARDRGLAGRRHGARHPARALGARHPRGHGDRRDRARGRVRRRAARGAHAHRRRGARGLREPSREARARRPAHPCAAARAPHGRRRDRRRARRRGAPGDVLLVRPSEIVPVDATLRSAEAAFDESSITGESVPVEKQAGDAVLSGSVNGQTAVEVVATATAADSQYQQIVALVAEAAASRAPVVRLADRYAVPFTLFSLALAGVAWWLSGDPVRFAEVLVLATPCPLLIAAPVAFIGGMSRAARNGVIVKGGGVLEQLASARTAVFDKTGTLTYGTPTLVAIRPEPRLRRGRAARGGGLGRAVLVARARDLADRRGPRAAAAARPRPSGRARRRRTASRRGSTGARSWSASSRSSPSMHRMPRARPSRPASSPCTWPSTAASPARCSRATACATNARATLAGARPARRAPHDDAHGRRAGDRRPHRRRARHHPGARGLPAGRQGAGGRRHRRAPRDHGRRRRQRRARARGGRRRHRDGREGRDGRERVGRRRDPRRRHLAHGDGGATSAATPCASRCRASGSASS